MNERTVETTFVIFDGGIGDEDGEKSDDEDCKKTLPCNFEPKLDRTNICAVGKRRYRRRVRDVQRERNFFDERLLVLKKSDYDASYLYYFAASFKSLLKIFWCLSNQMRI